MLWLLLGLLVAGPAGAQNAGAPAGPAPVYVVNLHGEIDRSMMVFIRRGLDQARAAGAHTILFDIDTFGGRVDSALQITSVIGAARAETTVAYVTSGPDVSGVSWSAGALIAFSCDRIYMAPGTSMGAAAPVFQTPEGMEMAPEKVVSPLRAQMAALAEKNGYPKSVAVAMVDADVELFEAHQGSTLRVVTADEYAELERLAKRDGPAIEKGKLVSAKGKLLTLTAGEAERYGVSSGTIESLDEVLQRLGHAGAPVVRVGPTAPDEAVALLTSAAVTTLLIMAGLVALFVEITTPGFGVPGTIAIACFSVVFASNALLGNVGSLEVLLFVAGLALLIVEIFVLPGFGVVGVSGIALMVASLVLSRQDFVLPVFDFQWDILRRNLLVVLVSLGGGFVGFAVAARFLPKIGPFRGLVLSTSQRQDEGFSVQPPQETAGLVGTRGTTATPLRPVGKAAFGDAVIVVTSEGEFVEAGTSVEIVEVSANRVIVRRV